MTVSSRGGGCAAAEEAPSLPVPEKQPSRYLEARSGRLQCCAYTAHALKPLPLRPWCSRWIRLAHCMSSEMSSSSSSLHAMLHALPRPRCEHQYRSEIWKRPWSPEPSPLTWPTAVVLNSDSWRAMHTHTASWSRGTPCAFSSSRASSQRSYTLARAGAGSAASALSASTSSSISGRVPQPVTSTPMSRVKALTACLQTGRPPRQRQHQSSSGGKKKASELDDSAPTSEMKSPSLGTTSASRTAQYRERLCYELPPPLVEVEEGTRPGPGEALALHLRTVVQVEALTSDHGYVGDEGHRCQVLQVAHPGQQQQRHEDDGHVVVLVDVHADVLVQHLSLLATNTKYTEQKPSWVMQRKVLISLRAALASLGKWPGPMRSASSAVSA
ncbi:Lactate utilization protein B [Frankliniella fusca]|uniref:Lactate utilization protein B n=1 Tax=Frankliniella fusca TaxID=407009 RepID=A0AAE1HGY7_9NEOP|nr:Lactate utilization protein B [Frankliniella fusca]